MAAALSSLWETWKSSEKHVNRPDLALSFAEASTVVDGEAAVFSLHEQNICMHRIARTPSFWRKYR
jgi:hypothetical protein